MTGGGPSMGQTGASRSAVAEEYLFSLPYEPYRVQEEALLAWFTAEQGVLVCAPTGTGKTLIAQAALFEALKNGATAYYTTPLIALTEQKFLEIQASAVAWGFSADDVGLVTGNRRVNPRAKILVVVAEILLNRLLHPSAFDFTNVSAVVVDEFHSFADPERGIVWELTLALLPPHVRLLLLSATVGNSAEFLTWLQRSHGRRLELVQDDQRRVPLHPLWVGDRFLGEQLEWMAQGDEKSRKIPALVFCFNREECWSVAEQLKGLDLSTNAQRAALKEEIEPHDWTQGVGPKFRQLLLRGVGVHHAGLLPKYRRLVEDLYLRKLLSVCVCTETLAAGINLPARSVVLTSLVKGPKGKKKVIDASSAQQICGRAGRPQFDDEGYVFAMAHEDDVRIFRWQQKYDAIPDHAKDPGLIKAKKDLWRKRPTRRDTEQYWNEAQFQKLLAAPPGKLYSKGPLPWRLLAYLLKTSPDVEKVRAFVRKRLLDQPRIEAALKALDRMLLTLAAGGFVTLDPPPPAKKEPEPSSTLEIPKSEPAPEPPRGNALFGRPAAKPTGGPLPPAKDPKRKGADRTDADSEETHYRPITATPTPRLDVLLAFRSVHPLYGAFLLEHLGVADLNEKIQALESVLEMPRSMYRYVRIPWDEEFPVGPLASTRLDAELLKRGLIRPVIAAGGEEDDEDDDYEGEDFEHPPALAEKLRLLFDATHPDVDDVHTNAIWAAGELLRFGGDFNKYVRTHNMVKQEGIVFRHLLRLVLLCAEFASVPPADGDPQAWRAEFGELAHLLTQSCRAVDPVSTDKLMSQATAADLVEGESHADAKIHDLPPESSNDEWNRQWNAMLQELFPGERPSGG